MAYCDQSDVYYHGIPRGSLRNPARLVASVSIASDWLELDDHGLATDDPMRFRAEADGSLPTPLAAAIEYYAIRLDDSHFQVAATAGGSAIDLTAAGSNVLLICPLPFAKAILWADGLIDDMLPAHVTPLTAPYPPTIVAASASLAAWKLSVYTGGQSVMLGEILKLTRGQLDRWAKGVPIRGTNAPTSTYQAASSGSVSAVRSPWTAYGGIR